MLFTPFQTLPKDSPVTMAEWGKSSNIDRNHEENAHQRLCWHLKSDLFFTQEQGINSCCLSCTGQRMSDTRAYHYLTLLHQPKN